MTKHGKFPSLLPLLLPLLIGLALGVRHAAAAPTSDTLSYRVKKGDSLELLAAEYYGDRHHAVFLMVANKIVLPRPLRPGEVIKIPVTRELTTNPGDTYETLAQRYLGDSRRAPFLAEFNGAPAGDTVAAGATVSVPFHLIHIANGDEPLASISTAYFGNGKSAALLAKYNFLDKDLLAKGDKLIVPIIHVRVRAAKLPPLASEDKARSALHKRTQELASLALPVARSAARSGDFAAVKRELASIELMYLDGATAVEVGLLLGLAYVAFGDDDSALAAYREVLRRQPARLQEPYRTSPRVLAVWQRAGGKVLGTP